MDLEKAYDRINRYKLWCALISELNLDVSIVKRLMQLYSNLKVRLTEDKFKLLDEINVGIGLK